MARCPFFHADAGGGLTRAAVRLSMIVGGGALPWLMDQPATALALLMADVAAEMPDEDD